MANAETSQKGALVLTGVNGFPGHRLLHEMDQAVRTQTGPGNRFDRVLAIDVAPPKGKLEATKFFRVDLTGNSADQRLAEIFAKENVHTVVHLAFRLNPNKHSSASHELHSIGTMQLLNACAQQRVRKLVLHSSTYCYGAFPNNPNFLSEDHPLRGGDVSSYIRDRVDVEKQVRDYQREDPSCQVVVLRPCSIIGPSVQTFATRYLSRRVCLTPLGFDPLIQLVHEDDVLRAFLRVLDRDDVRGAFNIVGDGVLPLLTLLRLSGRLALPVATPVLTPLVQMLWQTNVGVVPPSYLDFIRYLWVADGEKAREQLDFVPQFTTRDALLAFVRDHRLKQVGLG